ncbi:DUF4296 domain-containing protein [Kaistella sp. DKR-2]|uniref:DUF4296 domain-containing protein n=1 Tax=Kaistella soli TaxID=2849654 RepID=UPI001C261C8A|nr:DUF4296 domain-containing protein [Kaistella soli]MBU8883630.1 DUF4296 domain-containing protein [Kaistella soli]
MKNLFFVILSFLMLSCSELIDPPKNLIEKDKMSELIAEFAMNDQLNNFIPDTNIENATRYALKKQNINAADFIESYKFYTATGDIDKILNNAQEIVLTKDPAAKEYIEKKLKENKNVPAFAR